MKKNCANCGFYIPVEDCRDDLKEELQNAKLQGVCGGKRHAFLGLLYIENPEYRTCGTHFNYLTNRS